ncbi:hypothetical protein TIFTF001_055603, partial [Ficus carica]
MAGIPQKTVVWTANRDSPPVTSNATLQFTSEGRFVLRSTTVEEQYIRDQDQQASSASILDSGILVLYSSSGGIVWESFNYPTDTLLPTQRLRAGSQLVSGASESDHSSGLFLLGMQPDGNLVQYPAKTLVTCATSDAYYASNTYLEGDNVSLVFDANIYLYLLNSTGVNIKNITDRQYLIEDGIYLMRIDVDGIFRLYSYSRRRSNSTWSIEWSSSNDKCSPRGLCGFNMYCVLNDQEAVYESSSLAYDIKEVPNTSWVVAYPYSIQQVQGKEGCMQACSDDCNCEAAFYKDGECRKQRLPLQYGRRSQDDMDITLIKVCQDVESTGNEVNLRSFTYEELEIMTDDFKEEIGKGSFGTVYKGTILNSQMEVAVKKLEKLLEDGEREFQNEMKAIGRTHHK